MIQEDQRGFVLSGVTLLLILPALLLSVSFLNVVETGEEAVAVRSVSDKVVTTAWNIERMVSYMDTIGITLDNSTLRKLAENYREASVLDVKISPGVYDIWENVHESDGDDSYPHYAGSKYCEIKAIGEDEWYYSFEDLDPRYNRYPDNDRNEPTLHVKRLDNGDVRVTFVRYDGGYTADIWFEDELLWEGVGSHVEPYSLSETIRNPARLVHIEVTDPAINAHFEEQYRPVQLDQEISEQTEVEESESPVADAGGPYSLYAGESIELDGTESYDPDGSIQSYSWEIISGPGSLSDADTSTPVYTAPEVISDETIVNVGLTVTDNNGQIGLDNTTITVYPESEWEYRKKITINPDYVDSELTNFPMLFHIIDDKDVGKNAQSDGDDIMFTNSDGITRLDHEIESYSVSGNKAELWAWIRIPTLYSSDNTVIYMYYGNDTTSNQEDVEGVWESSAELVYHFNEESGNPSDSTGNNSGVIEGGVTQGASGKIQNAYEFNGSDSWVRVFDDPSIDLTSPFSIYAWINVDDGTGDRNICQKGDSYAMWEIRSGGFPYNVIRNGGWHTEFEWTEDSNWFEGDWHQITFVYSGSRVRNYLDGSEDASYGFSETTNTNNTDLGIGVNNPWLDSWFDGRIDEFRIYSEEKSPEWLSTAYNNQNNPSAFYTVGSEEAVP